MASAPSSTLAGLTGTAPTLADWQVQIGSVVMGPGTNYIVTSRDGFGSPEVRSADVARTQDDGDWMGRDTYASRLMTLNVTVRGATPALAQAAYQSLLQAWYSDPTLPYTNLWWKFPGLPYQRAIGHPRRLQADYSRLLSGYIRVVAEFYSPFSALYGESQSVSATPRVVTGGGRTYPLTYPKTYTVTSAGGQSVFITNTGSYQAYPIVTVFNGNCSFPRLNNQTTGAFIGFDVTLSPTDTLVIDMRLRTALLSGVNVRQYLSAGATWFTLPPAVTTELLFAPASADAVTTATTTFSPSSLG